MGTSGELYVPSAGQSVPHPHPLIWPQTHESPHISVNGSMLNKRPYNHQGLKCLPAHSHHLKPSTFLEFALPCQLILHHLAGPTCRGLQRQYYDLRLECFNIPSNHSHSHFRLRKRFTNAQGALWPPIINFSSL